MYRLPCPPFFQILEQVFVGVSVTHVQNLTDRRSLSHTCTKFNGSTVIVKYFVLFVSNDELFNRKAGQKDTFLKLSHCSINVRLYGTDD
jgi:hypothetical protein